MDKKNKSSTTTIKQTISYGKSKTVTVEIIKKKDSSNEYNKIKNGLKKRFYLAGGIRNNKDIFLLKEKGVNGVILSNALHEKKIIYKNL